MSQTLIDNISRLHTTPLGIERVARNLNLNLNLKDCDVVALIKDIILSPDAKIERRGKNYYIHHLDSLFTVNAHSYTIITAHKLK